MNESHSRRKLKAKYRERNRTKFINNGLSLLKDHFHLKNLKIGKKSIIYMTINYIFNLLIILYSQIKEFLYDYECIKMLKFQYCVKY